MKQSLEKWYKNAPDLLENMQKVTWGLGTIIALGVLCLIVFLVRTVFCGLFLLVSRRQTTFGAHNLRDPGAEAIREFSSGQWGVTVGDAAQQQAQAEGAMPQLGDSSCADVVRLEPMGERPESSVWGLLKAALTCNKCSREFQTEFLLSELSSFTRSCDKCENRIDGQINSDRTENALYVVIYPMAVSAGGGDRRPRIRLIEIEKHQR